MDDSQGSSATVSPLNQAGVNISQRLYSLDALRGLDMLMIIGVDRFFHSLAKAANTPFWNAISDQFDHPAWNGLHLYDLIFPLFLFIAGVATPYSIANRQKKGQSKNQILKHIIIRGLVLVLLGIIYNNRLQIKPFAEVRFASVLGRIGLAYMFANIIFLYTKQRGQMIWCGALLVGYWLMLKFTSAPGFPMGDLTMEGNFVSYFDRLFLPGHLYEGIHDPEGILGTIPAIGTGLLGILTGNFLKNSKVSPAGKSGRLAIAGIICIIIALIWNLDFPINKNLWTSSFVMCAGGISLLLVALFYYIIDVRGKKSWAFFLKVIGMNSILIYMSEHFINWPFTNESAFKWLGQLAGDTYGPVAMAVSFIFIQWLFLYILYRKKIFLKV